MDSSDAYDDCSEHRVSVAGAGFIPAAAMSGLGPTLPWEPALSWQTGETALDTIFLRGYNTGKICRGLLGAAKTAN
jgi:hypothetical protein